MYPKVDRCLNRLLQVGLPFLLMFAAFPALAAPDGPRLALVIGNAAYDGDAALANPVNDAADIAQTLAAIGWTVTKVINGDLKAMNRAIDKFHDDLAASERASALLFYAGHGVQIGGVNYLIPVKEEFETANDITHYAVSLQDILDSFDDAKVSTNIVILDACRDNPFVKKNSRSFGGTRGLTVVKQSTVVEGSAIMFSTAPGETAADGNGRNGVFTQALLKYLSTDLKLQDLATKVTGEVKRITAGAQVPFNSISLSEDFFLMAEALRAKLAPAKVETVAAPVTVDEATVLKAGLIVQKQELVQRKQQLVADSSWAGLLSTVSWSAALGAAAVAGYAYYVVVQSLNDYATAPASKLADLHNQGILYNLVFKVSLSTAGGAAGLGLLTGFFGADTRSVDQKIRDVDQKLSQLGGS